MIIDMGYWTRVGRRILFVLLTMIGLYLAFRLASFYIPFLIAFIISVMIEPIIKWVHKKTRLTRKVSAVLVLIVLSCIIIGLLLWGITSLISESANLLSGLNEYAEKAYTKIQILMDRLDWDKIQLSENVTNVIQDSTKHFLATVSNWIKNALGQLIQIVTSIPTIAIYTSITLLATYFICTDRFYILDQMEHHLPNVWVKKIGIHVREIISQLGGYLKAQAILVLIAFFIVLVGLFCLSLTGFNVQYPLLAAIGIGFIDALPILGSGSVIIPWAVISGLNGDIKLALALLVIYAMIMIVRQTLEPKIVSKHIGIHPIFTLVAMYTGLKLIGIFGMFLGPIILIILQNIFATLLDRGVMKAIFDRK